MRSCLASPTVHVTNPKVWWTGLWMSMWLQLTLKDKCIHQYFLLKRELGPCTCNDNNFQKFNILNVLVTYSNALINANI